MDAVAATDRPLSLVDAFPKNNDEDLTSSDSRLYSNDTLYNNKKVLVSLFWSTRILLVDSLFLKLLCRVSGWAFSCFCVSIGKRNRPSPCVRSVGQSDRLLEDVPHPRA